jgi:hypothetical protein
MALHEVEETPGRLFSTSSHSIRQVPVWLAFFSLCEIETRWMTRRFAASAVKAAQIGLFARFSAYFKQRSTVEFANLR